MIKTKQLNEIKEIDNFLLERSLNELSKIHKKIAHLKKHYESIKSDISDEVFSLLGANKSISFLIGKNIITISFNESIKITDIDLIREGLGDNFYNFVNVSYTPKVGFRNFLTPNSPLNKGVAVTIKKPTFKFSNNKG